MFNEPPEPYVKGMGLSAISSSEITMNNTPRKTGDETAQALMFLSLAEWKLETSALRLTVKFGF